MAETTMRDRIKALCRLNGTTARQLEIALGFGGGYISKIDLVNPNQGKIRMIADYFSVSPEYILTGEGDAPLPVYQKGEPSAPPVIPLEEKDGYYFDSVTADIAQRIYDSSELRLLFMEARDASPQDLLTTYSVLAALKRKERGNND